MLARGTRGPALTGRASLAAGTRAVRPHPGGLAAVDHQDLDHRGRGTDRPLARVGDRPLRATLVEDAPDAIHAGAADEAPGDRRERGIRVVRREGAGDRVQGGRLLRTRLRLGRPVRADPREPPDHERDEQEQDEVQPLGRVGDDEREPGLGEQQVVDDEGGDRGDDAGRGAQAGGDDDDRDEIDRRSVELVARRTFDDRDRDRRDREHGGDQQPRPGEGREGGPGRDGGDRRDGHPVILVRGTRRMR